MKYQKKRTAILLLEDGTIFHGKAAGAIGDFAMDKLGGQKIKDWGTKALTGIADSAFGQGASSLFAGAGAIAPYAVLAKEVYDFMGNTKDAYEGYEQGIKNAGVMQILRQETYLSMTLMLFMHLWIPIMNI